MSGGTGAGTEPFPEPAPAGGAAVAGGARWAPGAVLAGLCGGTLLAYALVGDVVLAELVPEPRADRAVGVLPAVLALAPAVLAALPARRRATLPVAGLIPVLAWASGHPGAAALGVLLTGALLAARRGLRRAAALAVAAAGAAELLAVALVSGSWLPGLRALGRPVAALVGAHGLAAVPVLACGAAAAGLLLCRAAVRHRTARPQTFVPPTLDPRDKQGARNR
ncbi:hypothetical protein [Streptomyces sp. URMC 129]|uniref:hypothetical protein n=1 Tax=Streptomyces sp. URMC 129 TaxID=3423407 RepID=UPI003F19A74E